MPHVAARTASRDRDTGRYQSHRPEQTLLYQIVDEYYPAFAALMAEQGKELPGYVQREFEEFLQCGRLEHGFLRVRCESCHAEHLVAFSCKRRGFCPSCGARRMAESAALLVDEVLPEQPMRQWVLSFPFQLRFLFASRPEIMGWVLGIVYRVIATHLVKKAGHTHQVAKTGAVTLIQRFWIGAQSECSLPHAVSRRCVCRAIPRLSAFPLGQGADQPRAHPADAHHRPPGGSLSGTARPAGTGCRKQLSGLGCGG
ncbi:hypothetical protein GTK47_05020 [Proteus sp. ZN5]|nr:hypothetical protein GTK47_05020 [Proteus sp. ZN5]